MRHIRNQNEYVAPTQNFADQWEITCQDTKITGRIKPSLIEHIDGTSSITMYEVENCQLEAYHISIGMRSKKQTRKCQTTT